MNVKEYLKLNRQTQLEEIRAYNKALIEKYPWLRIRKQEDFDPYPTEEFNEYDWTWLDDMPDGWRIAFSENMCVEIQRELERTGDVNNYTILQVKEKWGGLRWYAGGESADCKVDEIVQNYERASEYFCIECGAPAKWMSTGWISPYCDNCKEYYEKQDMKFVPMKEN